MYSTAEYKALFWGLSASRLKIGMFFCYAKCSVLLLKNAALAVGSDSF